MFNGFQQTGQSRAVFSPSNLFAGFPERPFSANVLPIVTSGIQAWWIPQSGITLSGSTVTSWVDLLGGYNLQPSSAGPTYTSANPLYRGYPSIGGTNSQSLLAGNILNIGTNTGITIVAVVNIGSGAYGFLSKALNTTDATGGSWNFQYYSGVVYFTFGQGSGYVRSFVSFSPPATVVVTGVVDRINGLLWTYVNNLSASAAASTTLTNYTPTTSMGINAMSSQASTNTTLEILVYNRALAQTEVYQNVTYLRAKYGI